MKKLVLLLSLSTVAAFYAGQASAASTGDCKLSAKNKEDVTNRKAAEAKREKARQIAQGYTAPNTAPARKKST